MTVKEFAGILSHQMLHYLDDEDGEAGNEYNSRMMIGGQQTKIVEEMSDLTRENTVINTTVDTYEKKHELEKLGFTINKKGKKEHVVCVV